jgi:outer membrane lipoprotein SlyB
MLRALVTLLGLALLATAQPAAANAAINCATPTFESERLLCKAKEIKARRVQTVVGGALAGALLGNLLAKKSGGDASKSALAGAIAGGLTGYWLNQQNEIAAKAASQTARAAELKARATAEAKRQRASAASLRTELRTVLLRSSDDPKKREVAIAQVAQAATLGLQHAQESGQGYTRVGDGLGTPMNGNGVFASAATDFNKTRIEACSRLSNPGSYCS